MNAVSTLDPVPTNAARGPTRRWPIGTEVLPVGTTYFRVWAPPRTSLAVVIENAPPVALENEGNGYHSGVVPAGAGTRYRLQVDDRGAFPDPMSRFQPDGPHGPSEVVDPTTFAWTDHDWKGVSPQGRVLYEMHIGTFTQEGTWKAAEAHLPRLADMGINLLELMPLAEFPGRFGWGYDGVNLFAPTRLYGRPDDVRSFVNRAHQLGIGVILDVVYNHVGPDGNYLKEFATAYFTDRYHTDWGEAINFDGSDAGPVREFFLTNAAYWITEFHFDGLRLDATQNIYDESPGEHILAAISRVTREAAGQRSIVLVAENEPQHTQLVRSRESGGYDLDMLWNDDFHHSARVAMTGRHEAYYADHRGRPQEFLSAIKYGYLFQGQYYTWQEAARGSPALDLPYRAFVSFLDNHDQIANSGAGLRCHALTSPGTYRTMTALMLLSPATPMLFQGQEFAASTPFHYFADHKPELAAMVRDGRLEFLTQFPSLSDPEGRPMIPDPDNPETFEKCKLDPAEARKHEWAVNLHRDLLKLRREDPTFRRQAPRYVDGAVLSDEALLLRYFGEAPDQDRLLLINLGMDLDLFPMPEPLLAPPLNCQWSVFWASEWAEYGGTGVGPLDFNTTCRIPGQSAVVMAPVPADQPQRSVRFREGRRSPQGMRTGRPKRSMQ